MRRPFRLAAATLAVCFVAAVLPASGIETGGIHVAGFMPFGLKGPVNFGSAPNSNLRFIVDPGTHRGFLLIEDAGGKRLAVYDLKRLRVAGSIPWPRAADGSPFDLTGNEGAAVDEVHHRIFLSSVIADQVSAPGPGSLGCDHGTRFVVVDTAHLTATAHFMPCVDRLPFAAEGVSYDPRSDKVYVIGMYGPEYAALSAQFGLNFAHEPTRYVQLNAETLAPDWAVDASSVCDWHEVGAEGITPVVARSGSTLVSFCYRGGAAYNFGGTRGQTLLLPLKDGRPVSGPTGPAFQTSPTYTDSVTPTIDPRTGRVLLYSSVPPYGRAVWGYDPFQERFFGVVPAGEPSGNRDDLFQGFDPVTGRLYITNPKGIVMVDGRQDVLSGGVTYPALANSRDGRPGSQTGYAHDIGIDGHLGRLLFPYPKRLGFVIVDDGVPVSDDVVTEDPDQGTADIAEVAGKTESSFSGSADAFGAHVVLVGGIPGAIDNVDQTCLQNDSIRHTPRDLDPSGNRRCLADQYITSGNREYFFAQSGLELGSESGVSAFGTIFHVPENDSATGADFAALAACFTGRMPEQIPSAVRDGVGAFCRDQTPLGVFREGTHTKDGTDVPFPGANCVDETGTKDSHSAPTAVGASSAECDDADHVARAASGAGIVGLPDAVAPVLSIARVSSSSDTVRTGQGVVTTVTATASGIDIGGVFTIGRVHTEAVTKAHGRSGTTLASFTRTISDVRGGGFECHATCDPAQVVQAFNQAFATQGRLRLPEPLRLASPHGFQGIVVKDPNLRASDIAILNDDTDTFNGLDLILNNDGFSLTNTGPNARSRFVISLAGVHAESRYGVFPVTSGRGGTEVLGSDTPVPLPSIGLPIPQPTAPSVPGPRAEGPTAVAQLITDTWRLIVNHPGQAAVLFVLLGLLGSPVYLGLRSRAYGRSVGA